MNFDGEMASVKLRCKEPDGDTCKRMSIGVLDNAVAIEAASEDLRFAAAVAQFGLVLRGSRYMGNANFASIRSRVTKALGGDARDRRSEFLDLVNRAATLKGKG